MGSPWDGVHGTHIDSARHYPRHWHATHGIGLVEQGAQHSASGCGPVDAYAGDVITTNPGEVHDGRPLGTPSRRWRMLYFDPGVLAAITGGGDNGATSDATLTRPVIHDERAGRALKQLFERLDAWAAMPHPGRAEWLACEESLLRACAPLLWRDAGAAPLREAGGDMKQVRDRLADELLEPPSLTELATMAGLSKYQLLRRFEKAYGVPPHAWLLQQRAERARALIRAGASLVHAAVSCGFADQSHMTRIFVRHFGFTPGAWRRAVRPQ